MKNTVKFADVDNRTWAILFENQRSVTAIPAHGSIMLTDNDVITDVPDEFFPEGTDWTGDMIAISFSRGVEKDALLVTHVPIINVDSIRVWELELESPGSFAGLVIDELNKKSDAAFAESKADVFNTTPEDAAKKTIPELHANLEAAESKNFTLQSHPESRRGIYWDPQWSPWIFKRPNKVYNSDNDLWEGLQDLDRRFTQLWDKQHSESYELLQKFLTIMQQLHPEKTADELIYDLVSDEFGWFKEYGQELGNFEDIVYGNIPVNNKEEFEFWYKLAMELKDGE